jgi:2-iminobutanoate/2-iminopropanoate deaminase
MDDFSKINEVYAKYFTSNLPARTTVAVKEIPLNALFEIETIAYVNNQ